MNVNFETIEKAWFKPKKTALDELERWLEEQIKEMENEPEDFDNEPYDTWGVSTIATHKSILDKIQELKKENENDK